MPLRNGIRPGDWLYNCQRCGAPLQWPDVPETLAESITYTSDPEAWDFYP